MDTQKRPVEGFRLSPQQEHLWSLREIDHSEAYRARCVVLIDGELNVEILRRAVARVVAKHEILRTNFHRVAGMKGPVQVINDSSATQIFEHDLSGLEPQEQESGIRNLYQALGKQAFDLTSGPSLKVWLVKQSASRHALILSLPGLCADAATLSILVKDIGSAYETGGREGDADAEPIQYADLSEWLNKILEDPDPRPEYWRENDFSALPTLKLPSERTPFEQAVFGPQSLTMTINPQTAVGLEQMAQEYGVSTSVVLQTCWHALLWRLLKTPEIIVGTLYDGRNYEDMEQAPGLLARYLPIRSRPKEDTPFSELLEQIAESTEELYDYQEYFNWNQIGSTKREAHGTFFSLCFDFEQRSAAYCAGDTKLAVQEQYVCIDRFKVKLSCFKMKDFCVTEFSYDANLYQEEYIELLAGQFHKLLEGVIDDPEAPLSEVDLLSQWQRDQLLTGFNQTARERAAEATLPELFLRQVERTPEAIAVSYEGEQLSYEELNRRANQLAQWLRRRGVGVESVVGLLMERSVELVIGLLGVLKAGAAYLPLEPSYPGERLEYMVADAGVRVLLTQGEVRRRVGVEAEQVVCVDEQWAEIGEAGSEEVEAGLSGANLAYVIYTSGSTGRPKGVMITHHAICNHMLWMQEEFALGATDRVLQKTPFSFDASVWEFYAPLLSGARLVLARPGGQQESEYLVAVSAAEQITTLQVVPSMLQLFLEEPGVDRCKSLQRVFCGGEVLSVELAERFYERLRGARLYNLYGPTEAAIDVSYWACEPGSGRRSVPIGRPIANLRLYILDEGGEPAALGVAGELHIGGVGLARGYWQRAELTAEKFIPDGVSGRAGERLYRTGDVARYQVGGEIEYVGRQDEQVKLRGYRIELGEVEAVVRQHEGVQAAVVVVQEGGGSGSRRLVCYVVWRGAGVGEGGAERGRKLQEYLRERLPAYMVPAVVLELAELPLQPNGKVDRKRLPEVAAVVGAGVQVGPRNEVEEALCRIWAEVLGVERVGIHNNFFELGGDSILGIQIVARANQAGLRLIPRQLFDYQTIAQLAAVAGTAPLFNSPQEVATGPVPLTPIQRRFFDQHLYDPHHWNQSLLLASDQCWNPRLLQQVVSCLLSHHDGLRLRFLPTATGWQQYLAVPDQDVPFTYMDLTALPEPEAALALERASAELQASLNLSDGPLVRVAQFAMDGTAASRVLIIIHHLVVDGVSWRILLEDLEEGYKQLERGETIDWGAKTSSYRQWGKRLEEQAQGVEVEREADYWEKICRRGVSVVPVERRTDKNLVGSSATVSVSLSESETEALLKEVPKAYNTQINDVLLTALAWVLTQWTGERSVLIELEGHGRGDAGDGIDLSRTVGWFTSLYPVLLEVNGDWDEGAALRSVKEQLRETASREISYGLLRYMSKKEELAARMRRLPQPALIFNYLGQFDQFLSGRSFFRVAPESPGRTSSPLAQRSHVLEVNAGIVAGRLQMGWTFSEKLHHRATIERQAESFIETLRNIIVHCQSAKAGGYTPSDFRLAGLEQQELDLLLGGGPEIEDIYPLSPMQQGMLFHTLYDPASAVYMVQLSCTLRGDLNAGALQRAWRQVIERHAIFRTRFVWKDLSEPLQLVQRQGKLPWQHMDWRGLSGSEQQERLESFLQEDRGRGFDTSKSPLMRLTLIQMGDQLHHFTWSQHHLLLDGWSAALALKEVSTLYEAYNQGQQLQLEPSRPYRDYIDWLQQCDLAEAEKFWREELKGFKSPTRVDVETSSKDTDTQEGNHGEQQLTLSAVTTAKLQSFAREHQLTLNTVIQGAWALLLSRYSGTEDVVFGSVVSGRPAELIGVESILGMFINTLPVRVRVPSDSILLPWLSGIQTKQAEARQYEYTPLVHLNGWSEMPPGMPLFESILVFDNYPESDALLELEVTLGITGSRFFGLTNYPLAIVVGPGRELSLLVIYDKRRFQAATVTRLLGHVQTLLEGFVAQPDQPLSTLPILTQAELDQLLANSGSVEGYRADQTVHQLFEAQVKRDPNALAVTFRDARMSYGELNARSNEMAHGLIAMGIKSRPVAIMLKNGPLQIVALLGALKAGCSFVCLDPDYPLARLRQIWEEVKPPCLISESACLNVQREMLGQMRQEFGCSLVLMDAPVQSDLASSQVIEAARWFASYPASNPDAMVDSTDLAYIVYTSGSTGRPKGIMQSHQGFCQFLEWLSKEFHVQPQKRVAQWASITYDASYAEIFGALCSGATLCLSERATRDVPAAVVEWINDEQISVLQVVPGFCAQILAVLADENSSGPLSTLPHLEFMLLAGEVLSPNLASAWLTRFPERPKLYNLYGPTETILATHYAVERYHSEQHSVPIGRAIDGRQILILDQGKRLCPVGVKGEIYVRSRYLTQGYWERPEETRKVFVQNPLHEKYPDLTYRTGDLGRWLPDGNIEFFGRLDNQVKIRGMRIEIEDIEAALSRHESVIECAVSVESHAEPELRLVAFVQSSNTLSPSELRRFLKLSLPEHMIPSAFVFMDALPHTPNMKVDRKALPDLDHRRPELDQGFVAPRTPTEGVLAQIWEDLLRVDRVGIHDNFFELGGHSLLATQVVNKIRHTWAVDLPLRHFFESPTVASLAESLESAAQLAQRDQKIGMLLERIKQLPDDEAKSLAHLKEFMSAQNN